MKVTWVSNFQLLFINIINLQNLRIVLKNMSKISISGLNKRNLFSNLPYIQRAAILVSMFDILVFGNIIHLETKFVLKNDGFFTKFLTKVSLK